MTATLRPIAGSDLPRIQPFPFTVSIVEPLTDAETLAARFRATGFWQADAGALAIEADGVLVGTCQFYRSAPCIHGYEIGYIVHDPRHRGRGYARAALTLLSDRLFRERPDAYRLQLIIEVWNLASWRVAERAGFVREGLLRSAGFGQGDPADCFIYARTRKDWHAQHHAGNSMGGS
jgi:RimJ/RimL family protein N-acetyltransferase